MRPRPYYLFHHGLVPKRNSGYVKKYNLLTSNYLKLYKDRVTHLFPFPLLKKWPSRSRQLDKLNISWADVAICWGIRDRPEMVDFTRFYGIYGKVLSIMVAQPWFVATQISQTTSRQTTLESVLFCFKSFP